jgi:hypothetical protein
VLDVLRNFVSVTPQVLFQRSDAAVTACQGIDVRDSADTAACQALDESGPQLEVPVSIRDAVYHSRHVVARKVSKLSTIWGHEGFPFHRRGPVWHCSVCCIMQNFERAVPRLLCIGVSQAVWLV